MDSDNIYEIQIAILFLTNANREKIVIFISSKIKIKSGLFIFFKRKNSN